MGDIKGKEYKVLDKGFVRLVDCMGGDARIVQAARVSYGDGTKTVREDAALIDYLMRHKHTSPFEQVELTFHIKIPIFVLRQMERHRTASQNQISGRYSVMKDEFYLPELEHIQAQSQTNKQGSGEPLSETVQAKTRANIRSEQYATYAMYKDRLGDGVARETARINLPLSLYTELYWKIDLHNLLHFLKLRMDSHAQYEIREYADAMAQIAEQVAPLAYASWVNHVRDAVTFSADEMELLRDRIGVLTRLRIKKSADARLSKSRARDFAAKIEGQ